MKKLIGSLILGLMIATVSPVGLNLDVNAASNLSESEQREAQKIIKEIHDSISVNFV